MLEDAWVGEVCMQHELFLLDQIDQQSSHGLLLTADELRGPRGRSQLITCQYLVINYSAQITHTQIYRHFPRHKNSNLAPESVNTARISSDALVFASYRSENSQIPRSLEKHHVRSRFRARPLTPLT